RPFGRGHRDARPCGGARGGRRRALRGPGDGLARQLSDRGHTGRRTPPGHAGPPAATAHPRHLLDDPARRFEGYLTANTYDDGALGELSINDVGKEGSTLRGVLAMFAMAASVA